MKFESWTYTNLDLTLKWETAGHFDKYEFTMNEYVLVGDVEVSETNTVYDMPIPAPVPRFILPSIVSIGCFV